MKWSRLASFVALTTFLLVAAGVTQRSESSPETTIFANALRLTPIGDHKATRNKKWPCTETSLFGCQKTVGCMKLSVQFLDRFGYSHALYLSSHA
jgi:hypothetical protein